MMKELIWAEHQKLRRSKIVLVAIFAVIMAAIIVFTQGQFSFGEKRYIDDAGWFMNAAQSLATFFVLPAVIALLGSYMICREEQEDTIKSLRLIPISEAKMTIAKLLIIFAFSVFFYLLLFGITFLVEVCLPTIISTSYLIGNISVEWIIQSKIYLKGYGHLTYFKSS